MISEKKREAGFEQDLEKLESIVNALEEGGLSLEDGLKQFEAGIRLTRKCEKALSEAERKIEVLLRAMDGELETQAFDEEQDVTPAPKMTGEKQARKEDNSFDEYSDLPPDPDDEDSDVLF